MKTWGFLSPLHAAYYRRSKTANWTCLFATVRKLTMHRTQHSKTPENVWYIWGLKLAEQACSTVELAGDVVLTQCKPAKRHAEFGLGNGVSGQGGDEIRGQGGEKCGQ